MIEAIRDRVEVYRSTKLEMRYSRDEGLYIIKIPKKATLNDHPAAVSGPNGRGRPKKGTAAVTYLEILKYARIAVKQEAELDETLSGLNRLQNRLEQAELNRARFDDCRRKLGILDELIAIETRK